MWMRSLRALTSLSLALRGLILIAVLAIAPLYETAHAMTETAGAMDAMPHMAAHDMSGASMANPVPASHAGHAAACRILCFGWVETLVPARLEGPVSEIALIPLAPASPLLHGIVPVPNGHPPKRASFV